jgi:hypothetical protein
MPRGSSAARRTLGRGGTPRWRRSSDSRDTLRRIRTQRLADRRRRAPLSRRPGGSCRRARALKALRSAPRSREPTEPLGNVAASSRQAPRAAAGRLWHLAPSARALGRRTTRPPERKLGLFPDGGGLQRARAAIFDHGHAAASPGVFAHLTREPGLAARNRAGAVVALAARLARTSHDLRFADLSHRVARQLHGPQPAVVEPGLAGLALGTPHRTLTVQASELRIARRGRPARSSLCAKPRTAERRAGELWLTLSVVETLLPLAARGAAAPAQRCGWKARRAGHALRARDAPRAVGQRSGQGARGGRIPPRFALDRAPTALVERQPGKVGVLRASHHALGRHVRPNPEPGSLAQLRPTLDTLGHGAIVRRERCRAAERAIGAPDRGELGARSPDGDQGIDWGRLLWRLTRARPQRDGGRGCSPPKPTRH